MINYIRVKLILSTLIILALCANPALILNAQSQEAKEAAAATEKKESPAQQTEVKPSAEDEGAIEGGVFQDQKQKLVLKSDTTAGLQGDVFSQRISLDLRDMDIVEAFKFVATKIGINVVTTKTVSGRISLSVEDVLIRDIFDIMLRSNGLAYTKQGGIYYVMTESEYKAFYGVNFSDMRRVKIVKLKYAIPEQAFTFLDAIKSEIGRVLVDPESGNVLIMDTPAKIATMELALAEFEKQNTVTVFNLKYAKAKEVEEILKTQLDAKKVGSVKADERNNQIVVQTLPERMHAIERLIMRLDRQTKEVLIDTKIVKIKLSSQLDTGFEWEGIFELASKSGLTYLGSYPYSAVQSATAAWRSREQVLVDNNQEVGSFPFSGTTSNYAASTKVSPGEAMHLGMVNDGKDFDTLINLLQTLGETRIISNPKIVAVNNQEAKIHIGERQAYVTTTTTASGQGPSTVSEEVQFVDIGIQISVTPNINDAGFITMKIKPEISSVASTLITSTNNKIPIIDTSSTETTVLVKDGVTVLVGGMRREEKTGNSAGLPFFSKLPFVGMAFKDRSGKTERTELLVMLTPHIISGMDFDLGNERTFGEKDGKEYQEYQALTAQREMYSTDIPVAVEPKPYRDYLTLKEGIADENLIIKEKKDEPYEKPDQQ